MNVTNGAFNLTFSYIRIESDQPITQSNTAWNLSLQAFVLVVSCLLALGSGLELDFIEHEEELDVDYSYGEGWNWHGPIDELEENPDSMELRSGRSDRSSSGSSSDSDSDREDRVTY